MYTRTDPAPPGNGLSSALKPSQAKANEQATIEERRAAILQGPSDPFPPVGPLPRSVAVRILSFLSLADQRSCALAGRALARAVADESNWSRRLNALDWCTVDGLSIDLGQGDEAEGEREIGRRRKGKKRQESMHSKGSKANGSTAVVPNVQIPSAFTQPATQASQSTDKAGQVRDDEDEFGDFTGPSTSKEDAFTDLTLERPFAGGSLASGTASVAMGGGRPHAFSSSGAPSFTPLSPVKISEGAGSRQGRDVLARQAGNASIFSYSAEATLPLSSASPSFRKLRAYAKALRPFVKSLADSSAPAINSLLFTCDLGLSAQTALLSNLLRFISASVGGGFRTSRNDRSQSADGFGEEDSLSSRGQEAAHRLLDNLLSSFGGTLARRSDAVRASSHGADTARAIRRAEDDMRTHANGIWELGNARLALALSERDELAENVEDQFGRMKAAKVFLERCEVLTNGLRKHNPLDNISSPDNGVALDFTAMDRFMADLVEIVKSDGAIIARVFPPEQDVLLAYADGVAQDVIAQYVRILLDRTRDLSTHLYLRACAATFAQSWKLVDVLLSIESRDEDIVTQVRCEDVVFHLWEQNMDDYLNAEHRWVRQEMQAVTEKWESDIKDESASRVDAAFLGSQNPAAVKRSVLSGFKDVLLLPVTVVPRTAGIVGGAVIRTAGTGLSTLNPLRWQSGGATSGQKASLGSDLPNAGGASTSTSSLPRTPNEANEKGYMDFSGGAVGTMDSDEDEDSDVNDDMNEKDEWNQEVAAWSAVATSLPSKKERKEVKRRSAVHGIPSSAASSHSAPSSRPTTVASAPSNNLSRNVTPAPVANPSLTQMQLLLSLDTALQVIHVNRDCLKRIETFKKYPEPYGERVREALQDVSLLLFRALGEGHIAPGFENATKQIQAWRPEDHSNGGASGTLNEGMAEQKEVEPLVHFFELVHVGDTIAQMIQVYFDQEMARHIDKNDFLNPVVKGRKRFESNLDEAVARGLNAGVDLLLGQAEHLITTRQDPKDYCPPAGQLTDLSPTKACKEAVDCLRVHCRMLVGSTDKNVLEVFYQEVGIRLHA